MSWQTTAIACTTMLGASVSSITVHWLDVPQPWQPTFLAGIPTLACLTTIIAFHISQMVRRQNSQLEETYAYSTTVHQIEHIWGKPITTLEKIISLAEERIEEAQKELQKQQNGQPTKLNEVLRIGYKCIQNGRAIHTLSSKGFPDQAYILCRTLEEQMVNINFMMTSGNAEEVIQRYSDWENAKFYRFVEKWKPRLDLQGTGPTEQEWTDMTNAYNDAEARYPNENMRDKEGWAIAYRKNKTQRIKAGSVQERARASMPRLKSDETLFHDNWEMKWQKLNEFVHTTPRSIIESPSAPSRNVIVTGPSSIGLKEPIIMTGIAILNLTSALTNNMPFKPNPKMESLGEKIMENVRKLNKELNKTPNLRSG